MTNEIYKKYNPYNFSHGYRLVKFTFYDETLSIKCIRMTGREFSIFKNILIRLFSIGTAIIGCTIQISSIPFRNPEDAFFAYNCGEVDFVPDYP